LIINKCNFVTVQRTSASFRQRGLPFVDNQ
jgi:hypothetical protein